MMLKTKKRLSPVTTTKTKLMGRLNFTRSRVAVWISAVFLMLMLSNVGFAQQSTSNYLKKFKPVSVELMQETGIPASVILGIAMLESGTGTSKNAKLLHNHFGIVGRNNLSTTNPGTKSRYKQYLSDVASYEHFVELLTKKKWFADLKGNSDHNAWLQ
jgi:flagellum-specific peptidoglycan hydrolase FlgJ